MKIPTVIPALVRNLYKLIPLFVFFVIFSTSVFADSRSDFDFQYSKYRQSYSEFSLYKTDYLSTSSLDNQQKALLAAKQAISTRDLTKASFAAYIRDLIAQNKLKYEPLLPVSAWLLESQQFFLNEASKGQSVVTMANLNDFDTKYNESFLKYEKYLKVGVVAQKVAKLKNLSLQQQNALNAQKAKMPETVSVRVTERIALLESELTLISEKIDSMANFLISDEGMDNSDSEVFFTSKIDQLIEIRELQLSWMDKLIDLDLNYAKI
jgi:hypothetical protein